MNNQPSMSVLSEHRYLAAYLKANYSQEELQRPLLTSFTQWTYAIRALGEIASEFFYLGSDLSIALWSEATPLLDIGWQTHSRIARVFASPTIDQRLKRALKSLGVSDQAFEEPPQQWKPVDKIPRASVSDRASIRSLLYRGAPLGKAILATPPSVEIPLAEDYVWPESYVESASRSFAYVYDSTEQILLRKRNTLVCVTNGRFLHDQAVAAAARAHSVPVAYFDSGGLETDFDFTSESTHDWASLQERMRSFHDSAPSGEARQVGSGWFESRSAGNAVDNHKFVALQKQGKGLGELGTKQFAAFFSSSNDEIYELDVEWSRFFGSQEGALQVVADVCHRHSIPLVVRTHPHLRFKSRRDVRDWHNAVNSVNPVIHLDENSDVDSYALMSQAQSVVTYGSTIGVESAFTGKPVLVLGPSAYDQLGCVSSAASFREVKDFLLNPMPAQKEKAIPFGLMMRRRGFLFRRITKTESAVTLGGVHLREPSLFVRHLSHFLKRFQLLNRP